LKPLFTSFFLIGIVLLFTTCYFKETTIARNYSNVKVLSLLGKEYSNIPDSIFKYKNIEKLFLGPSNGTIYNGAGMIYEKTNHIKFIPEKICEFKKLQILDLTSNEISTIPDLTCLTKLSTLSLAFNNSFVLKENMNNIKKIISLKHIILTGTNCDINDLDNLRKSLNVIFTNEEYLNYLKQNF
jgi:hypothetical protein